MAEKCILCKDELEKTFMEKAKGTVVKIKNSNNENESYYVCSACQKKYKDLKKEVEEKVK